MIKTELVEEMSPQGERLHPLWMPGGRGSPAIAPEFWRCPQRTLVSQSALRKVGIEETCNSTSRRSMTNPSQCCIKQETLKAFLLKSDTRQGRLFFSIVLEVLEE